ncbi:hypothetical protein Psi01_17860 [Planobispora siamensis]|uniref:Uncharacterized protein n=1 Tax=Planobispora siamensis TaxID=936338 RepID=A0A8J3WKT3_9ACTN|nr:hypothetical protein Psi01_17860 [Planobispora siamensis]
MATAWRYVEETARLLSARSPKLDRALRKARKDRLHYLVLDGMLIRIDRVRADRPYYSAKHRVHGMNIGGHRFSGRDDHLDLRRPAGHDP